MAALAGLGALFLDALPISLYVVDRELNVVFWNRERERGALGQPRSRVLGRHLRFVLSPGGFKATEPLLREVLETGEAHEHTLATPDSRLFHVRRLPVRKAGRVTHVLSLFEDVTEQRALEMRVIASDRLAFLGQLAAGVAHEISNPLAGIAGCAEALASLALRGDAAQRREAGEFRELIRGEVARCERIVRSLLETARPQAGEEADLASAVTTALRVLERHPAFGRVRVVSRLPRRLPPVRIEPDSLKQVVMALAVNAAKAMKGRGRLTLRAVRRGSSVHLDVLDTGPGVPVRLRQEIFRPFFTTEPGAGTGLGLAIARSLVRGRGGDLVYVPQRSGGAFRVSLKLVPSTLRAQRQRADLRQ